MSDGRDGRDGRAAGRAPAVDRRIVGWTETRVEGRVPPGFPDETDYYVAVSIAAPTDPVLTVGRVPPLARLGRWIARRTGLGARIVPDAYVPAPDPVERVVATRVAAGLDDAAVADRAADERELIAAGRFDDGVAARNREVPVGLCIVSPNGDGFEVAYGWFAEYR